MGLKIISITDHDKVDAHIELENVNIEEYYSGRLIKGIELKTSYKSIPIEILGYGIDTRRLNELVIDQAKYQEKIQIEHLEHLKKVARRIGLEYEENIQIDSENIYASATFVNAILKNEKNKEIIEKYNIGLNGNAFYRNCQSNPNNIFYIDESKHVMPPQKIIEEIHETGGLAFLAHPLIYPFENIWNTIEEFVKEYNIDGLECYYSLFSNEESKKLVEICNKYDLYKSGGSDYHGLNKPDINMGIGRGNLNIPAEIVKEWISKIN